MHDLLDWIREQVDGLPRRSVDAEDVVDELEETPLDPGYERLDEEDREA